MALASFALHSMLHVSFCCGVVRVSASQNLAYLFGRSWPACIKRRIVNTTLRDFPQGLQLQNFPECTHTGRSGAVLYDHSTQNSATVSQSQ